MKIVFLDFDGVLNHVASIVEEDEQWHRDVAAGEQLLWDASQIEPEPVKRLNTLLQRTGAYVVVTSTWRKRYTLDELRSFIVERGFEFPERVLGVTPQLWRDTDGRRLYRGDEIQRWLEAHPAVTHFVILDDDADMVHLMPSLVQTSMKTGLLDEHVEAAVVMLGDEAGRG